MDQAPPPGLARETLAELLAAQGDRLYALALRTTRDPDLAAEAVQEAFASALEHAGEFAGAAKPSTWLHRIVYTKSIDQLRRRRREVALPDEPAELGPEDDRLAHLAAWPRPPDELLFAAETRAALERAIGELAPVQRAILELMEMEGHSSQEVGQMLGLPPATVRVYLHRARLRLRARLAPHFRSGLR